MKKRYIWSPGIEITQEGILTADLYTGILLRFHFPQRGDRTTVTAVAVNKYNLLNERTYIKLEAITFCPPGGYSKFLYESIAAICGPLERDYLLKQEVLNEIETDVLCELEYED